MATGVGFLSVLVAILAVVVTRANVQRQIMMASRETWMREFREQVVMLVGRSHAATRASLTHVPDDPRTPLPFVPDDREKERRVAEALGEMDSATLALRILILEKGEQYAGFLEALNRYWSVSAQITYEALQKREEELEAATADILRRERAAIEQGRRWSAPGRWSQLKAWLTGRPHFPN